MLGDLDAGVRPTFFSRVAAVIARYRRPIWLLMLLGVIWMWYR